MRNVYRVAAIAVAVASVSGCTVEQMAKDPNLIGRLQLISAGHTGCMPKDHQISLLQADLTGGSLWKATCKGRTYMCSGAGVVGGPGGYSCAPEVE
jgi:hypothetical protein